MAKNTLINSHGTGMAGGIRFDEDRTSGILGTEFCDLVLSTGWSGQEVTAIWERQKILHPAFDNAQSMFIQFQVTNDLGLQQAHSVSSGRVTKAGMKFLGHTSAADHAPPLKNSNTQSRHAQIGGAGQAIVAGTDYDGVNIGQGLPLWVRQESPKMETRGASRCPPAGRPRQNTII